MDDAYLLRLKKLNKADEFIAAKMGISVEEVRNRWSAIVKLAMEKPQNGFNELRQIQLAISDQFRLLGSSIGVYFGAMNESPDPSELRKAIESCPPGSDLAAHLLVKFIILRPFRMPSPAELAQELMKANPTGN